MDTKLIARIGAGIFVASALAMTALQLREEPVRKVPATETVSGGERDPHSAILHDCAAMGERALGVPDCRAAWAEKRRRFLGVESDASIRVAADKGTIAASSDPQPAKGQ
jgi:conjugative transfer region protein TrbK